MSLTDADIFIEVQHNNEKVRGRIIDYYSRSEKLVIQLPDGKVVKKGTDKLKDASIFVGDAWMDFQGFLAYITNAKLI